MSAARSKLVHLSELDRAVTAEFVHFLNTCGGEETSLTQVAFTVLSQLPVLSDERTADISQSDLEFESRLRWCVGRIDLARLDQTHFPKDTLIGRAW